MKLNWGKLLLIIVAFIIFIGAIVAVANGGKENSTPRGKAEITIISDAGLTSVHINNQNVIGGARTVPISEMPYTFLCSKGDSVSLTANILPEYTWDAWLFQNKTFINRNPLVFTVNGNLELTASCQAK